MTEETKQLIAEAKELGLSSITIDGVKYEFYQTKKKYPEPENLETGDVYKDLAALDDLSDEEALYWSTPYFDELQSIKEMKAKHAKEQA